MDAHRQHPKRLEILIVPEHAQGHEAERLAEVAIRSALVEATGETGASGYPRYAGGGIVADVDPESRTVEALLVDGSELDYGLSARVREPRPE
ncbi:MULTISPECIES: hypothetical protein [Streptomyces]|nr:MULTISPECIES: hypothetical protein [Streptomyces]KAF0647200.1 hypothetical protein K701_24925 [Streptomyces fradiae ATCC 10745 = DSM 40063]OSY50660.1 hypothetical protein BG846_03730 [Streptomyces fradiae ATCC 10745 = DSM 40063]QEV15163.1 hypothetical protein CP974_27960 [Streptomyces fradiae ATCC 10745 = DSM 40063]UQS30003.1 hypothetical protein J5J01_24560 [Streptomyces fradiae]WOI61233.1 hypothetical protein RYQ63_15760 [Streptomyces fradiae]